MDDFDWFGSDDTSDLGDLWGNDNTDYSSGIPGIDYGSSDYSGYSPGLGDTPSPTDWSGTTGVSDGSTDWTNPSAGTGTGGFPWSQALLSGGGAVLQGLASEYKDKEDWKARTDYMKAQLAEQEKYYQLHGKQLSDALGNYKQFATANKTNPVGAFGLLAGNGGVSGYFH